MYVFIVSNSSRLPRVFLKALGILGLIIHLSELLRWPQSFEQFSRPSQSTLGLEEVHQFLAPGLLNDIS